MHKLIVAIIRRERLESVSTALKNEGVAFTYSEVKGFCREVRLYHEDIQDRIRVEITLDEKDVDKIKNAILSSACCGMDGDGCLSVYHLDEFINFS